MSGEILEKIILQSESEFHSVAQAISQVSIIRSSFLFIRAENPVVTEKLCIYFDRLLH